ncbi:hypothetical protein L915_04406, partial [Phytophthora nicotianae]
MEEGPEKRHSGPKVKWEARHSKLPCDTAFIEYHQLE